MMRLPAAALATLLAALPAPAAAVCLGCTCSVSYMANAMAFGNYNPLSASHLDVAGGVHLRCYTTAGLLVAVTLALDHGLYASGFTPRQMASGANRLDYNLYTDAGHTTIWGDGSAGTATVQENVTLALLSYVYRDYTVYGRIPGGQSTARPGSYGDTVTITVTYD